VQRNSSAKTQDLSQPSTESYPGLKIKQINILSQRLESEYVKHSHFVNVTFLNTYCKYCMFSLNHQFRKLVVMATNVCMLRYYIWLFPITAFYNTDFIIS